MLCIHQYNVCILYQPGPDVYIVDWLSHHNHTESKGQEIAGMNINIHILGTAIGISVYTSVGDIRNAVSTDAKLQMLQTYIIRGWPQNWDNFETTLRGY